MDMYTYTHGKYQNGWYERYGYQVWVGKKRRCMICKKWTPDTLLIKGICMECRYRSGLGLPPKKY